MSSNSSRTPLKSHNNNDKNDNKNNYFYSAVTWQEAITRALTLAKR